MGRDTSGVRGMNVSQPGNAVLAMDVARDDQELLVVTENGYGKRTPISDYPVKGRGTMGVKTITLTENKGALAGALVVREHQELVFISQNGMVQRTSVRGINRYGRASQGVRVMNIRDDDQVSAVALVVESEASTAAPVGRGQSASRRPRRRRGDDDSPEDDVGGDEDRAGEVEDDAVDDASPAKTRPPAEGDAAPSSKPASPGAARFLKGAPSATDKRSNGTWTATPAAASRVAHCRRARASRWLAPSVCDRAPSCAGAASSAGWR